MNTMMKSILCTMVFLNIFSYAASQVEINNTAAALMGAHVRLFAEDRILAKMWNAQDINAWSQAVQGVQAFCKKNITLDKELTFITEKLTKVAYDLVNIIQDLRRVDASVRKNTGWALEYTLKDLKDIEAVLRKNIAKRYYLSGNQQSAEMLEMFVVALITTIEKIQREVGVK